MTDKEFVEEMGWNNYCGEDDCWHKSDVDLMEKLQKITADETGWSRITSSFLLKHYKIPLRFRP